MMSQPAARVPRKQRGPGAIIAALILAEVVGAFELTMMYVAIPTLINEFQVDTNAVAWTITGFLLVSATSAALGGRLGDMYGRKKVLLVVLIVAGIGSLISLIGGTLIAVIIGRTVQGVAGAVMALAFGLAREHLESKRVPVGVSMIGASALIAGSVGAFISGALIQVVSWHAIFVFAAVLAAIATVVVAITIPRDAGDRAHQKLDVLGAILLPAAVTALLLGLSSVGQGGFASPTFIALAGGALVVAVVWVIWELRVHNPIVNIRMFKNRHISLAMTVTFLAACGPIGGSALATSLISQYPAAPVTEVGLGLTPAIAGLLSAAAALIGFALSPLGGVIARRFGARVTFIVGTGFLTVSLVAILLTYGNLPVFVVANLGTAIGISLFYGALPNILFEAAPATHSSEVTGANTLIRNIGQSAATAVGALILASAYDPATTLTGTQGFTSTLLFCIVLGALALVVGLFLQRHPKRWIPVVGVGEDQAIQADAVDELPGGKAADPVATPPV